MAPVDDNGAFGRPLRRRRFSTLDMTITATLQDPLLSRLQAINKLISSGLLQKAAKELNAAVKMSPADPRIFLLGARLAEAAGNHEGAAQSARKAVSLAPDWPVGVTELAFLLARQGASEEAVQLAERAVQLDGDNPELLARVIDVAHRSLNFDIALRWLQRAVALTPDNASMKRLLARDLRLVGRHAEAVAIYDDLIANTPADKETLLGRVQSSLATGDMAAAQRDCEILLTHFPDDEEIAYWLALSQGRVPERQPASMVQEMFDGFADAFDQHLVGNLKYTLPREVARIINERYPSRALNVLDLGCGTGLLGACLGRIQGALIGVDVSQKMIDHAVRHNVYDRFHLVDVLEALQATPDGIYDVIAALDVFVYVGDLSTAVPNAFRVLKPGGHLIFSCEKADDAGKDLVLRPTQRYAHNPAAVEQLCRTAGFTSISMETMTLRMDNGSPVEGFLLVAGKPA